MSDDRIPLMDDSIHMPHDEAMAFRITTGSFSDTYMKLFGEMEEAIEFIAHSWWRRTLINLISAGRIVFHDGR